MRLSYYVYYRVPPANVERARSAILAMQRELRDVTGVAGRLMRRRDDASTWMEIYEDVQAEGFEAELARAAERHALASHLVPGSTRKQEVFREI